MKIRNVLTPLAITGAILTLLLIGASPSFAANPPIEGNHFQGPAIRGQFVFTDDGFGSLKYSFTGTCGAADIVATDITLNNVYYPDDVSEENLLNNVIPSGFIPRFYTTECEPHLKNGSPDGLYILQINSYHDFGSSITADVIMLWVVPQ